MRGLFTWVEWLSKTNRGAITLHADFDKATKSHMTIAVNARGADDLVNLKGFGNDPPGRCGFKHSRVKTGDEVP